MPDPIVIDTDQPLSYFYIHRYLTLKDVRQAIHAGYLPTIRILLNEGIPIYRLQWGLGRNKYFISREYLPVLINKHGCEFARQRRLQRKFHAKGGIRLTHACPRCGKTGKLYRNGSSSTGNSSVKCGWCERSYTYNENRRQPLTATCPYCAQTTGQSRRGWRKNKQRAECGHCQRSYTLDHNPDAIWPPPLVKPSTDPPPREHW